MGNVIDLNGIKDEIKSILDTSNVIGANPVDLSNGMTSRVAMVFSGVRPDLIPVQASSWPFVTSYVTQKPITGADIAKDQLNSRRMADVTLEIVGGVYNDNYQGDEKDPAEQDINCLMENIELVLRGNPNLNGKVLWQVPTDVQYFSRKASDSEGHIRAGVITLKCKVSY